MRIETRVAAADVYSVEEEWTQTGGSMPAAACG